MWWGFNKLELYVNSFFIKIKFEVLKHHRGVATFTDYFHKISSKIEL